MTAKGSANPNYPDAHPTAPGGMSEKALVKELVDRHDWRQDDAEALSWPRKIDAVIEERRMREQERHLAEIKSEPADPDDDLDPEQFFAELAEAQADPDKTALNNTALFIGMPDTRDFIFDGHAGAGPSGAERWMNCTESLGMARKFLETLTPNQQKQFAEGSTAARQGTTAHAAAEAEALLVLGQIDEAERDATLLELTVMPAEGTEAYDEEMGEYISEHVDLIRTYAAERGDDHVFIEQRVQAAIPLTCGACGDENTEHMCAHQDVHVISGSADVAVMPTKAEPDLVVVDLKYGNGIDVDVVSDEGDANPQTRIYALGVLDLLTDEDGNLVTDVQTVTYVIAQPRLGGVKTFTETLDDLLDWRDDVLAPALYAALTGDGAVFAPGDKTCQWCPARGTCPALAEQRVEQAAELFDVIVEAEFADGPGSFPETTELSDERLGALLSQIEGLVKIKDDLREEAQRRLHRGNAVPGYKLVGYTPPRKWEDGAAEALDPVSGEDIVPDGVREALWQHKLLTPKQALTVLKKVHGIDNPEQVIGDLYDNPVQKPVIARVDDRRHEWKGAPPEQMFPEMGDDE